MESGAGTATRAWDGRGSRDAQAVVDDWVEVAPGVRVLEGSAEHEEALVSGLGGGVDSIGVDSAGAGAAGADWSAADGVGTDSAGADWIAALHASARVEHAGVGHARDGGGQRSRRIVRWVVLAVLVLAVALVLRGVVAVAMESRAASGAGPGESGAAESGAAESAETLLPSLASIGSTGAKGAAGSAAAGEGGQTPSETPDWWSVLGALDLRRTAALTGVDAAALDGYLVPDSAAWATDARLIEELAAARLHPQGLSTTILAVERIIESGATGSGADASADRGEPTTEPAAGGAGDLEPPTATERDVGAVELVLVDSRSAYALVDESGEVVQEISAAPDRRWWVTVEPAAAGDEEPDDMTSRDAAAVDDPGWRISEVRAG